MAKINKQEVSAVASKLQRELSKIAEVKRKYAMEHYAPSETYLKVKELLEKIDFLSEEYDRISSELDTIRREANEVCPFYIYNGDDKEKVLNHILSDECKLLSVPSIEELKDDVTIAAIDDSFNTASFINEQIAKFG